MAHELAQHWQLNLPAWVTARVGEMQPPPGDEDTQMQLAIALAEQNGHAGSGGPFGALVVDHDRRCIVAAGVNLVFSSGASFTHAEMVALTLAQRAVGNPDLSQHPFSLITSAEPCAMCMGALPWSGISRLVCGARDEDARAAGFDEGSKPENWPATLEKRGIEVRRDLHRSQAAQVLMDYSRRGGRMY